MKKSRRAFIQETVTAAVGAAIAAPAMAAPAAGRGPAPKNVLFIGVDDLATQIGCYGRPALSPHLDRLARRGVLFNKAYCQYPLCSPSRSSLLTGLAPDRTRVFDLQRHFRETLPDVTTLPQLFRANGYRCMRVGKIFHAGDPPEEGTDGLDDPMSWDWTFNPVGVDHTKEEPLLTNLTPDRALGNAIAFHRSDAQDKEITDGIGASEVIRLLREPRSEPFFLAYGLYRPHVPWVVPGSYFDQYDPNQLETYPLNETEMTMAPPAAYWSRPLNNLGMTPAQQRQALQGYYAATTFMDAQVGRVLHELEVSGLAQNTLVVFWADHGWQLGQHGQWEKQTLFEAATRVPLIFAGAGVAQHGKVCERTVEHLDLYPTIAELCGLQRIPMNLHGESLVPLLHDVDTEWSKPAISQISRPKTDKTPAVVGYSIRDERYRYTTWNEGKDGEELYDYVADPHETMNRANDVSLKDVQFRLSVALRSTTLARGRTPMKGPAASAPA